jgi:hypothetical protein
MKEILLSRGLATIVDVDDFWLLSRWKWRPLQGARPYVFRTPRIGPRSENRKACVYMHRLILGAKPDEQVDHINANVLDNRRSNLRLCTPSQNMANVEYPRPHVYRGVTPYFYKWQARISVGNKTKYLGLFRTAEDAAVAYNRAAIEEFGEFARLNEVSP